MIEVTIYKDLASYSSQEILVNEKVLSDQQATDIIESYKFEDHPDYLFEYEDEANHIHYFKYHNEWRSFNRFMEALTRGEI